MVATYRRQSDPLLAPMEQPRNYDADPFLRAVHILSKRLVAARIYTVSQIDAGLQILGYEYVDDRKVRYWAQMQPDLPEQLIKMKVARPENFPIWAQPFLKTENGMAPMAQNSLPANSDASEDKEVPTRYVVGGTIAVWLGYKILKAIFRGTDNPSDNSQQSISIRPTPWQ